jgi:uncharacterized glyoxalase superfamily protein PhnB
MDTPRPVLDQVNIVADDIRRSMEFYRRLGASFREPPKDGAGALYHVGADDAAGVAVDLDSAGFAQFWNQGWAGRSDLVGRVVLGFGLASREAVDDKFAELTGAGHVGLQPPYDAFWGARYAVVEDPSGLAVGLMSPIDPTQRKALPPEWGGPK